MNKIASFIGSILPSKGVLLLTLATLLLISYLAYSLRTALVKEGEYTQTITQLQSTISEMNLETERFLVERELELNNVIVVEKEVSKVVCEGSVLVQEIKNIPNNKQSNKITKETTSDGIANIDDKLPDSLISILDKLHE